MSHSFHSSTVHLMTQETPALDDPRLEGVDHTVVRHGRVNSLVEAAAARGIEPSAVLKTMVVRISDTEYVFVLVPGDRVIDWPKLRDHLGVNRLSLPDADTALSATGYVRGTITPLGSTNPWPVVADSSILGKQVSVGGGAPGVSLTISADDLITILGGEAVAVTKPA